MIKITIQNKIKIDQQEELIYEEYEGEFKKLAGKNCLLYENDAKEKVLIKFNGSELYMIRYLQPPLNMRFKQNDLTDITYPGLGTLSALTEKLLVKEEAKTVDLHYQLLQNEQKIGHYQMAISWEEL